MVRDERIANPPAASEPFECDFAAATVDTNIAEKVNMMDKTVNPRIAYISLQLVHWFGQMRRRKRRKKGGGRTER